VTAFRVDFSLQQPFSKGVGCWSNCRGRCEVQVEIERVVFEVGYLDVSEAFKSRPEFNRGRPVTSDFQRDSFATRGRATSDCRADDAC